MVAGIRLLKRSDAGDQFAHPTALKRIEGLISLRPWQRMFYALGPFRLDTEDNLLLRGHEPLALGRRAIALLRALVERPSALVSKEALIKAAWPNQAVEDGNLTVQIAALRRVLGETPGGDSWIETMPRRGYRFVGPVIAADEKGAIPVSLGADAVSGPMPAPHHEAERRQITAMSCELARDPGRADGSDLEDWREAVGTFQRCVAETVARHNGFIAQPLGNIVLVLFGYPAAHEHDAEQAVRAGLDLCAAVRALRPGVYARLRCRVGIATGMVIIGDLVRVGGGSDHEIIGDAANLAVRLQVSAQPGTVVLDSLTRQLIGNLFDGSDLDAIEAGDGAEPIRGWHVLGERVVASRFEALRGPALSPLVGRNEEINLLLHRWGRAKTGDGQIVLLSGEPGIGKSRLTVELQTLLRDEPHLHLRYFCSPHHQDSALHPFVDQLGRAAGFVSDDPPATRLEKLAAVLARTASSDEDVALLADLLSLPSLERHPLPNVSPQQKKERTLEALIRQLEGLARLRPVVMIFEDAHWVDPTSRELLDLTVEHVRNLQVLLIVTFRPEFQPPWTGQPQVTLLSLNRLDRRDRIMLIEEIAGDRTLPDEVVAQIADRSDGVPLFVEELTKSLLESGLLREERDRYVLDGTLPRFAIPTSLRASLLTRLDRLESVRLVAQIGAAIGREFPYTLLRTVSRLPEEALQLALARLVGSELVFQRGLPPDALYSFKHALVQDAAHGSLLRSSRQQLHARIAEALEAGFPEVMDSQPELLAQHYAEAGLVEKSVVCWGKAGHRSAARSAMVEAAAQFHRGLDQLSLLPDGLERQRKELEFRSSLGAVLQGVKGYAAPETGYAYARARVLWEQLGSPSDFLQVPYGESVYHMSRGELDLALRQDEDLLRLSFQRNESRGLVLGHYSSGRTLLFAGRFASSQSHLNEAVALYDASSHRSLVAQVGTHPHVSSQALLGIALFCLGFPDQAVAQSNAAITEARRLAHPPSLSSSLVLGTTLLSLVGDSAGLGEWVDQLVALATEQGFSVRRAQGMIFGGWLKVRNGEVTKGISLLRGGTAAFRATGSEIWTPYLFALLSWACEIAGQIDEGVTLLDEALQVVERTGERWFAAELNRHKGQLLLRQGHAKAAEEHYWKALGIAREQQAKLWELRAAASLARLRRDQARRAEAHDLLVPVYSWFTEGFGTADLKEAKERLDELT